MKYTLPVLVASSALALVACDSSSGGDGSSEAPTKLSISNENATLLATIVMDTLERRMDDGGDSDLTDFVTHVESYDQVIVVTGTTGSENCDVSGSYSTERSAAIDYTVGPTNLADELAGKEITLTHDACVENGVEGDQKYTGVISASHTDAHSLNDNQIDIETDQYKRHMGQGNNDDTEREYLYSGQVDYRDEYNTGTQVGRTRYTFTDMEMTVAYKGNTAELQEYAVNFRDITLAEMYDNNSPSTEDRSIDGTIEIEGLKVGIDTLSDGAYDATGDDETRLHVVLTGQDDTKMVIRGVDASQVSIAINGGDAETVQRESLVLSDPASAGPPMAAAK